MKTQKKTKKTTKADAEFLAWQRGLEEGTIRGRKEMEVAERNRRPMLTDRSLEAIVSAYGQATEAFARLVIRVCDLSR